MNVPDQRRGRSIGGIIPSLREFARVGHHVLGFDEKVIETELTICLIIHLHHQSFTSRWRRCNIAPIETRGFTILFRSSANQTRTRTENVAAPKPRRNLEWNWTDPMNRASDLRTGYNRTRSQQKRYTKWNDELETQSTTSNELSTIFKQTPLTKQTSVAGFRPFTVVMEFSRGRRSRWCPRSMRLMLKALGFCSRTRAHGVVV